MASDLGSATWVTLGKLLDFLILNFPAVFKLGGIIEPTLKGCCED